MCEARRKELIEWKDRGKEGRCEGWRAIGKEKRTDRVEGWTEGRCEGCWVGGKKGKSERVEGCD